MDNKVAKNQEDIERYRNRIFKAKEECRRLFRGEPFEKKLKISFDLYKTAEYLKKFKPFK